MKIEVKEAKKKEKYIEADEELETGVYYANFMGEDRIIIVSDWENLALVIDHLGTVQSIDRDDILNTYTKIRKVSELKIEYTV